MCAPRVRVRVGVRVRVRVRVRGRVRRAVVRCEGAKPLLDEAVGARGGLACKSGAWRL